jgi:hypothetical protein
MLFISPPQNQPDQSFQGGIAFSLSLSLSLSLFVCCDLAPREKNRIRWNLSSGVLVIFVISFGFLIWVFLYLLYFSVILFLFGKFMCRELSMWLFSMIDLMVWVKSSVLVSELIDSSLYAVICFSCSNYVCMFWLLFWWNGNVGYPRSFFRELGFWSDIWGYFF